MSRKKDSCREPLTGNVRELEDYCDKLLKDMRHAQHVLMDLMLFLDTHPMDIRAREQYMAWRHYFLNLKQRYQEACGPLEWYGPNWWEKAMGYGYDPLDECFDSPTRAVVERD